MASRNLFHRAHYNIIAKQFREEFQQYMEPVNNPLNISARAAILQIALRMAKRFVEDNEQFDPLKFLNACSPDADLYPFNEFWEDYYGRNN